MKQTFIFNLVLQNTPVMKKILLFTILVASAAVFILFTSFKTKTIDAKEIVGAWGYGPENNRNVMINTDKVFAVASYDLTGKKFISSYGGTWRIEGNKLIKKIEWNSKDSSQVGKELTETVDLSANKLTSQTKEVWNRLDDGKPGALMGAWIITGN